MWFGWFGNEPVAVEALAGEHEACRRTRELR
jgi:hypothetical protein